MVKSRDFDLNRLMALSRDGSTTARRNLFENMGDIFLEEKDRLSEQERAHISDIMNKLIRDVELSVRITLAEKLTHSEQAPVELIKLLANDEIEVAKPFLTKSRLLMEADLLEIIEYRSKEHLLAITERDDISPLISDMLIEYGDEDIIEELVRNKDAQISKEALALLVEESKRVDRFQEPLLSRHDLPPALAHKMFWWVSAALRRHILNNFQIDDRVLDQTIALATTEVIEDPDIPEFGETHADRLAAHMAAKNELNEKTLIQTLRSKQIRLFLACFSILSGLDTKTLSRFVHDKNAEAMAVLCKALGFDRNSFSAVFMLTRRGGGAAGEGRTMMRPAEIEEIMEFYDSLKENSAKTVLAHWKLEPGYTSAIEELDSKLDSQRAFF
ncbi:DUF2336 domain-containing protein [Sneathiella glossodoripedis]|uniref:DUF2336 domain-containing protein n=1 Tax=Sneathiella glossodoripedis TaxID=418853 RepID=UPI000472D00B|nr:DUF2336 domain-containing protein [Sneathiella glossodoripedis]